MKKTFFVLFVLVGHIVYANDARDFLRFFQTGNEYLRNNQYDAAITEYDKALACVAIAPRGTSLNFENVLFNMMQVYGNRIIAYFYKEDYDRIIKDAQILISYTGSERSRHNFNGYYFRGKSYMAKSQYSSALSDLTEATKIDSSNTDAYLERAWAYYFLNDYDRARNDCNIVKRRDPDNRSLGFLMRLLN